MLGQVGPGKYGVETEALMKKLGAKAVVLIVIEGDKGNGTAMSQEWEVAGQPDVIERKLPPVLRHIADSIEKAF